MTTSVSRRLNILCIKFKIISFFIIRLFGSFYVRVGILLTCGKGFAWPHHFTKRGCLGPLNLFSPATFYLSVCTKTGKWAVMYLCVMASILPLSMVFLMDFGSVPTALYSYSCLIHFITNVEMFNLTWTWIESPISHPRCGHSNISQADFCDNKLGLSCIIKIHT